MNYKYIQSQEAHIEAIREVDNYQHSRDCPQPLHTLFFFPSQKVPTVLTSKDTG